MTLTPTEQQIELERESIPKLESYSAQIKVLCDEIEQLKDGAPGVVAQYINSRVSTDAHPNIDRIEMLSANNPITQKSNTEKVMKLAQEGYRLIGQKTAGNFIVMYFAHPGFDDAKLAEVLKPAAEKHVAEQLAEKEKELVIVREEAKRFKKSVQVKQAAIPSLADALASIK